MCELNMPRSQRYFRLKLLKGRTPTFQSTPSRRDCYLRYALDAARFLVTSAFCMTSRAAWVRIETPHQFEQRARIEFCSPGRRVLVGRLGTSTNNSARQRTIVVTN